jgi:NitT/TauT family transport system substrate-binding protein
MQLFDFASHHHHHAAGACRPRRRRGRACAAALRAVIAATLLPLASACAAADAPVQLSVGYMPYASSTWSGVVMRGKKFYEKHLPPGSSVEFSSALDGAKIAAALQTGQQQIGYPDDGAATLTRRALPARGPRSTG